MSSIAITGGATGTGVFSLLAPSTNTNRTLTLPDETGTLQISGGAISGTTGTFSGIVAANGGGIQFPATQVSSANANTLDDYEEGTWSSTISSGIGTLTTTSSSNLYTKIGSVVHWNISITITTNGTGASELIFTLPFMAVGTQVSSFVGRETALTGTRLWGYGTSSSTSARVVNFDGSYPAANGKVLRLSGTYFV